MRTQSNYYENKVLGDLQTIIRTLRCESGGSGTTIAFSKNGTGIASQSGLNLIEGTGVTITGVNNPTNNRVDYTINASGGSPADIPKSIKVSLTPKQFTSCILNNTPITLISSPGSGKYIDVISADMRLNYGTVDYAQQGYVGISTDTSSNNFKFVLQNNTVNNSSNIISALNTNTETQTNDLTGDGTIIPILENSSLKLFPYSTCSIILTGRNFLYSSPTTSFIIGETVTGDITGDTGIVWFDNGSILGVDSPSGSFSGDTTITGSAPGCVANIDKNSLGGDSTIDLYITYKIVTL